MNPRHLALVAAAALSACAALTASGNATGAHSSAATVSVVLTRSGPRISGPTVWRPGVVRISATSQVADQEVTLLRFRAGYGYSDFVADGRKAHGHSDAAHAAVAAVYSHTIFEGGIDLFRGQTASFAVVVTPGTYYLGEMTTRPQLTAIHVGGGAPSSTGAYSAATITATDHGYSGANRLPANGTITFRNAGSRPHRLNLIPVKAGTSRAQLTAYIQKTGGRDNAPPPPFALQGRQIGTADLSPGRRMGLTYRLPAGTYAAIGFDRDLRTGRADSVEGLATIVTLGA